MIIQINNNTKSLPDKIFLSDLSELKDNDGNRIAVAVNGKLIKFEKWSATQLYDGDNVLIINAAFGG